MKIDFNGTPFLETSRTGAVANRLNQRCELLLTQNAPLLKGKRVLDLASHDGRFSWACLQLGAAFVTGVEVRDHLVAFAQKNVAANSRFVLDDVFSFLEKSKPGDFDVILCFGFLYHTVRQVDMFRELKRLRPETFILDTTIAPPTAERPLPTGSALRDLKNKLRFAFRPKDVPSLVFLSEDSTNESHTIDSDNLTARPTASFIEYMLPAAGYDFRRLPWDVSDWEALEDYRRGGRASYLATARPAK